METEKNSNTGNKPWKAGWKIYIPVLIGLCIAGWLLYDAVSEVEFYEVKEGTGSYIWKDSNNNKIVDFTSENEFIKSEQGNFNKKTFTDAILEIKPDAFTFIFLLLAILMMLCRDLGYIIRIRYLTEKQLSWRQSFRVIMIWEFASAMTPGIVGGAAVAMFILKKEGINLGRSTAIVLITALLDELFYVLVVPVTILWVGTDVFFPDYFSTTFLSFTINPFSLFMIGFFIICLIVIFLLLAIFVAPVLFKKALLFFCRIFFLKKLSHKASKTGDDIILASKEFRGKSASFWAAVFGATVFSWLGRFMVINCLIWAFSPMADQLMVFARQLSMWVILLISPTPGGSGIAEFAFSGFLSEFVPFGLIGVLAIFWRIISYYPYLFIGAVIIPRWLKKSNKNGN
jgi:uncharacterized protein (TIRG00374 family)